MRCIGFDTPAAARAICRAPPPSVVRDGESIRLALRRPVPIVVVRR
jgi:hypothetical protein